MCDQLKCGGRCNASKRASGNKHTHTYSQSGRQPSVVSVSSISGGSSRSDANGRQRHREKQPRERWLLLLCVWCISLSFPFLSLSADLWLFLIGCHSASCADKAMTEKGIAQSLLRRVSKPLPVPLPPLPLFLLASASVKSLLLPQTHTGDSTMLPDSCGESDRAQHHSR